MYLNRRFIALILTCVSFAVYAKENKDLMRAKYYYSHYAYHDAIPYFEKVVAQLNDPALYAQLADCYSVTNDLKKAAETYSKAVHIAGCGNEVVLRYARMLMQLMDYTEAQQWLSEYLKTNKDDRRAAYLLSSCRTAPGILLSMPAGTVSLLSFNTDGSDFAPALWNDKLVFTSDTAMDVKKKTDYWTGRAYYNIYTAKCSGRGVCENEFDKLSEAKTVNIKYHTGPSTFSKDGKQMYYTRSRFRNNFLFKKPLSNKDSTVLLEIMIAADFDTTSKKFNSVEPFQYNNAEYSVAHPSLSPNGNMLVFSSNMPKGSGGSDLYLCKKQGNSWTKPESVGVIINTEGEEVFPYWADDATLFFSSDGHEGLGGLDIYKCKWDETAGTFSSVENIGIPLNSSYDDISLTLFADGRSTYFSSNRPAGKGGDNVYYYKKHTIFLQLDVIDSITLQPIAGVQVALIAEQHKKDMVTDGNGMTFIRLFPDAQYIVNLKKDKYKPLQIMFTATGDNEVDTIFKTVKLYTPRPDTMDRIPPGMLVNRTPNVMDTPGIRKFELNTIYEIGHFYYDYNKYELTAAHKIFLDTMLVLLNRHPTMRIEVRAHTDCRGSFELNRVLSNNRALSVVNFLIQHGISRKRLEYIGLGSSIPKIPCPDCLACTEEQHYLNRILEFRVLQL